MVRLSISSTATLVLLSSSAYGAPTERAPKTNTLLGYNDDLISATKHIPSVTTLITANLQNFINTTVVEPLSLLGDFLPKEKRYINGNDDRYQYTNPNAPWGLVGKLYWSNGVFCSGALIGPRHVLTAKHCYVSDQSGIFAPGFDNGTPLGAGGITDVIYSGYDWGTPCGWKNDWMILILDNRLGDQLGYFGAKYPDQSLEGQGIFEHIGYPGDLDSGNRPYRVDGNVIENSPRPSFDCDSLGPYYTDTDVMGGQSGGPHWQPEGAAGSDANYIWGTLSVTFDYGNGVATSGWGGGDEMLSAIINARNDYP